MVKVLDLRVCDVKVRYEGIWWGKCGYKHLELEFAIDFTIYVKYEIPRWTYHDKLVIKCHCKRFGGNQYIRLIDKVVTNTSNTSKVVEEIFKKRIEWNILFCLSGDDMRISGDKSFTLYVYWENWGFTKTITVTFYWDASNCTVSNIRVSGIEQCPIIVNKIQLVADKTEIYEGDTVNFTADIYSTPNITVKACIFVEGRIGDCREIPLDNNGHGVLKFSTTFPSHGTYHIKVCIVNPLTNEPIYCSNEVNITVEKVGKPKLEITINVDKTKVYIGDKVKVYGEVKNSGDGSFGGGTLYIYVDGNVVTQLPVPSIPPKHYINYSYELTLWRAGKHTICVDVK